MVLRVSFMTLLRRGHEVEYVDSIYRIVYRSTPFWVSPDGRRAFAIPDTERPYSNHHAWQAFDHASPDRLRSLFNFGPVSDAQIAELVMSIAPPFFFHELYSAGTRAKLGDGHSYGQHPSYFYYAGGRASNWKLSHSPGVVESLPDNYKALWFATQKHCKSWS